MNELDREKFEARLRTTGLAATMTAGFRDTIRADRRTDPRFVDAQTVAVRVGLANDRDEKLAPSPLPHLSLVRAGADAVAEDPSGDLVVLRRLGEGGMGTVDLARQRSLAR